MIWNDKKIREAGMITPFVPEQVREQGGEGVVSYGVSSFGYDVRLCEEFLRVRRGCGGVLDPKRQNNLWEPVRVNIPTSFVKPVWPLAQEIDEMVIEPGECVLGATVEKITVPENVMVLCLGKSTYARLGLVVNATPLEPGWVGHVTLELSNTNRVPVRVHPHEGIAQLLFFEGRRPAITYADKGGKYQNQERVPRVAKV